MTSTVGRRLTLTTAVAALTAGLLCLLDAVAGAVLAAPAAHSPITLLTDANGAQVPGMDVSSYQGNVDWNAAWRAGARFAYVKATEGTDYQNPYFEQQYDGSYGVGMIRGAYHFATPDRSTGAVQADYFVAHGGGWSPDGQTMPPMLDIEYNPYGATCFGLSQDAMTGWIKDFSDEVHAKTTRWPMIYTTTDWWQTCTGNRGDFSGANPLFIARYASSAGALPPNWQYYTLWQFSDSGPFPGDQDQFNGTIDRLRALAGMPAAPSPSSTTAPPRSTTPPRTTTSAPKPPTSTTTAKPSTTPKPSTSPKPTTTTAKPSSTPKPSTAPSTPSGQARSGSVPGLVWAGGPAGAAAPVKLTKPGAPLAVVAAAPRAAVRHPAAASQQPSSLAPPTTTSKVGAVAVPPGPSTGEPQAQSTSATQATPRLAHTGTRTSRLLVLGISLVLLGICLLMLRRETEVSGRTR